MRQISLEEGLNREEIEDYEEEAEIICGCKANIIDETTKSDNIRNIVVHGMVIYEEETVRDVLRFLAMYPSYCSVYEVVSDITAYQEEVDND